MACGEDQSVVLLTIPLAREARLGDLAARNERLTDLLLQERDDYAAYRLAAEDEFRRLRELALAEHAGLSCALAERDRQLRRVRWAVRLDEGCVAGLALVALAWERVRRVRWDRLDRGDLSPLVRMVLCVALFLGAVLVWGG